MTHVEYLNVVLNSQPSDWLYDDERGVLTHKADLLIRIEEDREDQGTDAGFEEPWANTHPDPSARMRSYDLYYGASFVERRRLVWVDGGRAALPLPKSVAELTVPLDRYRFAKAIDRTGTLDQYMKSSGLTLGRA